jgi:putative autoinducer-2 (AI-2) aldolase
VPIVIAGGPKLETPDDAVEMARNAIERGAAGVDMGRNVWQSDDPVGMIRAIGEVVHAHA